MMRLSMNFASAVWTPCWRMMREMGKTGIILDGYPRSLSQSEALLQHCKQKAEAVKILAVDIRLDEEVAIQKLLGRRICETCNQGFNMSDITGGSYDMPAILPNPKVCVLGRDKCFPLWWRGTTTHL